MGDSEALHAASCFANESMFSTINQKACSCCRNPPESERRDRDAPNGESGPHFSAPSITDPLG